MATSDAGAILALDADPDLGRAAGLAQACADGGVTLHGPGVEPHGWPHW